MEVNRDARQPAGERGTDRHEAAEADQRVGPEPRDDPAGVEEGQEHRGRERQPVEPTRPEAASAAGTETDAGITGDHARVDRLAADKEERLGAAGLESLRQRDARREVSAGATAGEQHAAHAWIAALTAGRPPSRSALSMSPMRMPETTRLVPP